MAKPDIQRLIDFQQLLLAFQAINRRLHVPPNFYPENDTEHSYNLAMAAWFLAEYFQDLDRNQLIRLALVHDLVEIHAGDTWFYATDAERSDKAKREAAAMRQLELEWPDFPDLLSTIHAYERRETPEARFIYALDKIMPILLVYLGKGYDWQKEGVTLAQLQTAKRDKVAISPEIDEYYQQLIALLQEHRDYFPKSSNKA